MKHIEIELTNNLESIGSQTPVDAYVERLLTDAKNGFRVFQWTSAPASNPHWLGFEVYDEEDGLLSQLDKRKAPDGYERYTMTTSKIIDGTMVYSAAELTSEDCSDSLLAELYRLCVEHEDTETVSADENLTNAFVDALIQSILHEQNCVHFERCANGFVARGFGVSKCNIHVTEDWSDETSAQYTMKVVKPDGTLIMSCAETSKHSDGEAEVRKLYEMLDATVPLTSTDEALEDIKAFIEKVTGPSSDPIPKRCSVKEVMQM